MKAVAHQSVPEPVLVVGSRTLADAEATRRLGRWLAGELLPQPGLGGDSGGLNARLDGAPPASWTEGSGAAGAGLPGGDRQAQQGPVALLLLQGELGAGKTCLVQGLAEGLGIDEPITSPTFALAQHYNGRLPNGCPTRLVHLDLYRLDLAASADELFGQEEEEAMAAALEGCRVVMAVEWPERLSALPEDAWRLRLQGDGEGRLARWQQPAASPRPNPVPAP